MNQEEGRIDLQLLSNFIHQVVNPLNGTIGTLDNLIDGTISEHKIPQRLKAVRAQLEHSICLIRNLAFFSQLAAYNKDSTDGKLSKICVLPQVVIEAAQFFQEEAKKHSVKIELVDRTTQYRLPGNPDLLRQVFWNLFDNGIKYGLEGTTISVDPRIQKKTKDLLVDVTGKSIGFNNDENNKIFQIGHRSPLAKNVIASGTGLGLHICREIVEKVFKGSIEGFHSKATEETTFRLRFPNYDIGDRYYD